MFWFLARLLFVKICVAVRSSPFSGLFVSDTPADANSAGAYTVANDSLQVLLRHGKWQKVEMDATGSAVACAEAGAPTLSLTSIAGGRDDLGDLNDTQVTEPGRKRWKEDNVAKEMLTRCAEDAAGRATAESKAIVSRLATRCRGT